MIGIRLLRSCGQLLYVRSVRVALGTGCHPGEGNRRASLYGGVSWSPTRNPIRVRLLRSVHAWHPPRTCMAVRSFPTHGQLSAAQGSPTTVSRSAIRSIQHFDSSALWSDGPEVALNWLFPYPI
jgi:hypothetical protein